MSAVISPSERVVPSQLSTALALRRPAVRGYAAITVQAQGDETTLVDLAQHDPLSIRMPKPARGDISEACVITTAGGIVGGDSLKVTVTARRGSRLRVYPQAAEKVYRSTGADSRIEVGLQVEEGAWLEWLPQETILFDGLRLRRTTELSLEPTARVMAGEFLVFGRQASGERLGRGLVHDAWRVYVGNRLVWADAFYAKDDLTRVLASPACLDGAGAFASFVYAGSDAASELERLRSLLTDDVGTFSQALSRVNGIVVGRFAGDARAVRQAFGAFWGAARQALAGLPPCLPRLWHL